MSLWRNRAQGSTGPIIPIWQGLPMRMPRKPGLVDVTRDSSLTHSVVWRAQQLRADLISSMPIVVYRKRPDGLEYEIPTPPVLLSPSTHGPGQPVSIREWLAASQMDLDSVGNAFGIIAQRNSIGVATQIDLVAADSVTVSVRNNRIESYKVDKQTFDPIDIWHERAITIPGMHVGLSPMAYAAKKLAVGLSSEQFALDWFSNGIFPSAIMKNKDRTLQHDEADRAKKQFMATVANGEPIVAGKDWDYQMVQAKAAAADFLNTMQYTDVELARFYRVPADLVDVPVQGSNVTYANVSQRNMQFLIMDLAPTILAREEALTRLTPSPQRVELDTRSLLRLDPLSLTDDVSKRIQWKHLTVDEARQRYYNLPPLDADQVEQFMLLFPPKGYVPPEIVPPADAIDIPNENEEVEE